MIKLLYLNGASAKRPSEGLWVWVPSVDAGLMLLLLYIFLCPYESAQIRVNLWLLFFVPLSPATQTADKCGSEPQT